ncbi:MAG: hypothetical protein LQ340_005544 [Diploschistes diacapsis]|nr:MAG: hypothetical protein LQ340_005544 [Diploschistes diacapsis]
MFLLANPGKGKTEEEKKEIDGKYTRGENVMPRPEAVRDELGEADRRMVEEVRVMSLRNLDGRGHQHGYERGVRHRHRSRERRQASSGGATERASSSVDSRSQARHIEHQSSLRSLISADEVSAAEMEEEILRQIAEEGLLDGIDLHNMTASQEDELSERIADAYRRRHHRGPHSPRNYNVNSARVILSPPDSAARAAASSSSRRHAMSTSASEEAGRLNPPVSRPHLLDTDISSQGQRRRVSSERRHQTSPVPRAPPVSQQAARSATDLSTGQRSTTNRDRRPVELSSHDRRSSEPRTRVRRSSDGAERRRRDGPLIPPSAISPGDAQSRQNEVAQEVDNRRPSASAPEVVDGEPTISEAARQSSALQPRPLPSAAQETSIPVSASGTNARSKPPAYPEPIVKCDRCEKNNLQYEQHAHCAICNNGTYNLCNRCYREGKGCLNWYGFGNLAWHRFQRGISHQDPPHALIGRQYLKPHPASVQTSSNADDPLMTTEDPSKRLLSGAFCCNCSAYASDCFWHCNFCNDGEFGFCNTCVDTGQCCTHPLLPIAQISAAKSQTSFPSTHTEATFAPITSPSMMHTYPPSNIAASGQYRPLTFSNPCDICHYPIQPSSSRYHCYTCNAGNYNICTLCYSKLVSSGRISSEDGDKGWRRCPKAHRMIKFFFEDTPHGQRRIIVNDLVGGLFLEDRQGQGQGEWSWTETNGQRRTKSLSRRLFEDSPGPGGAASSSTAAATAGSTMMTIQKLPPDGGVGMHAVALYARVPAEGARDELGFPRGAEVREAVEVSPEWYQGAYAGQKGLFPINHVKVIRVVNM